MREFIFFIIILLANIIQGITGFAGTILAMPFSIMLVGYDTAKPVLNVLGLLSGIYVFAGNRRSVDWKELRKIVLVMAVGIFVGMGIKSLLTGREAVLYQALGIFVIVLAVRGLYRRLILSRFSHRDGAISNGAEQAVNRTESGGEAGGTLRKGLALALLGSAGIVHGIFVSGGPLLIGYLTGRIRDKTAFRATISTVWILLNTIILVGDIRSGLWTQDNLKALAIAGPFLLGGMFIGGKLYKVMSQNVFMILTYVLLLISGISLLLK